MTPEEFAKKAQEIKEKNEGQAEANGHIDMDRLMVEFLESLVYKDVFDILFIITYIWYS